MYYYCLKDGEERGDHGWKPSKEWDTSKPGDLGWAVGIRTLAPSRREEQQVQKDRQTEDQKDVEKEKKRRGFAKSRGDCSGYTDSIGKC